MVYSEIMLNGEVLLTIGSSSEGAQRPRELGDLSIELFCYVDDIEPTTHDQRLQTGTILSPSEDRFKANALMRLLTSKAIAGHYAKRSGTLPDSKPK